MKNVRVTNSEEKESF